MAFSSAYIIRILKRYLHISSLDLIFIKRIFSNAILVTLNLFFPGLFCLFWKQRVSNFIDSMTRPRVERNGLGVSPWMRIKKQQTNNTSHTHTKDALVIRNRFVHPKPVTDYTSMERWSYFKHYITCLFSKTWEEMTLNLFLNTFIVFISGWLLISTNFTSGSLPNRFHSILPPPFTQSIWVTSLRILSRSSFLTLSRSQCHSPTAGDFFQNWKNARRQPPRKKDSWFGKVHCV